jgi:hypothetical protein
MPSTESCIDATGARVTGCVPDQCAEVPAGVKANGSPDTDLVRYTWLPLSPPPPLPTLPAPTLQELDDFRKKSNDVLRTRSYRDGVEMFYAAEINAANAAGDVARSLALRDRRNHFTQMALDHGLDENTTP